MKRGMRIFRCIAVLACLTICATTASASVVGTSDGAMSPRATSQSYGARLEETALGNYVADAMRAAADSDIAIVCGGHLVKPLPGGDITESDIAGVFAENTDVILVELTVEVLFQLLEYAVGFTRIDEDESLDAMSGFDGFPQVSGFTFEADVSQKTGQRLNSVVLEDGTVLKQEYQKTLTAAITRDMVDGTLGFSMLDGMEHQIVGTEAEVLTAYVKLQKSVTIPQKGRITLLGFERHTIYESLGVGMWLPYVILLILLFRLTWRRRGKTEK